MAAFNKFYDFTEQLIRGGHNFGSHTFKVALTNTAPLATQTAFNSTNHPAPTSQAGYAPVTTTVAVSEVNGTTTITGTTAMFTATGGTIGPFRYAILYNATNNNLIGWYDYSISTTLNAGDNFTVQFNNASPGTIFTLT
jgi:hypothetical protein